MLLVIEGETGRLLGREMARVFNQNLFGLLSSYELGRAGEWLDDCCDAHRNHKPKNCSF